MADPKDNLIKSVELPPEERSRRARIAAKASAQARKKKEIYEECHESASTTRCKPSK